MWKKDILQTMNSIGAELIDIHTNLAEEALKGQCGEFCTEPTVTDST
jgi:hypothetical protein